MKVCSWCKAEKSLAAFNRCASSKDGLQSQCRWCNREFRKNWMREDPERTHSYDRIRKDDVEVKARRAVRLAVKNGELVMPMRCSACGKRKPLNGHHADYTKPLVVEWLCRTCHEDVHFKIRELERSSLSDD